MAKVGLSGLHALKAFLQITDECLDNGGQHNLHHSVATVAAATTNITLRLLGRIFPWLLATSQW